MEKKESPLVIIVSKVNTKPNHPEKLVPLIAEAGYKLPVISGKTKKEIFNKTLEDLRSFSIPGAIFGPGVMKEGVNMKNLGYVILAGAGSSDIALIQRVGRALRSNDGKEQPLIIDMYDSLSFFSSQSKKRYDIYRSKYGDSNVEILECI
jgi:superfamily II DNA or RNA helicase